jgi:hypothetical protein
VRCIVTGQDDSGASFVVREVDVEPTGMTILWKTSGGDRVVLNGGEGELDLRVPPGNTRWQVNRLDPGTSFDMHWTRTLDFDLLLEGSVELVLDERSVTMAPGDMAVITGVRHDWRPGPDGCLMAFVLFGVDDPSTDRGQGVPSDVTPE